jgi:hypothetical protein
MQKAVLVVLMVGVCSRAKASVLCQKPNGAVFVRAACKAKEVQVDPVALGLQGPQGTPGVNGY